MQGLAQRKGQESAKDNPDAANQHHEDPFAHDAHRPQHIHLDQHQANEDGQAVVAKEIVGCAFKGDHTGIGKYDRCGVDKNQWRQVIEDFPSALFFQPEPEADHGNQYCHDAHRCINQGAIHRSMFPQTVQQLTG